MEITKSVRVEAPADEVWALVSDLPRMGELSPENVGGTWVKGATGPTKGAHFRGANKQGWRRWGTDVVVTRSTPGVEFAFEVTGLGLAVAAWSYVLEADGGACTLTETWVDRRNAVMKAVGGLASGVSDREAFTARSIAQTLAAVKAKVEG